MAAWLAKRDEEVAIVEKSEKMYGGACINVACIPTKSLIENANKGIPYQSAFKTKNDLTSFLRDVNYEKLDKLPSVTVLTGEASFLSSREVRVKLTATGETMTLSAKRIFLNTGSQPFLPPIEGLTSSQNVFSSISLLAQSVLNKELLILGGGFIGLEFADMYARFGAKVTILERSGTFLAKEDDDVSDEIRHLLTAKGINILTGITAERIEDINKNRVRLHYQSAKGDTEALEASAVLVAAGRIPNTGGLNLEAAGIKTTEKGYIQVDEFLKTNVSSIWAIGDCNGGPQFTYISLDDFRIIRDQLSGGNYTSLKQRKHIASSVFITPQFAHIGLREKDAEAQGYEYKVAKLPVKSIPRARIENDTRGFLKTIVDTQTNKILGCTLICAGANEMINTIQVAMNAGQDYQDIRDAVFTHPSMTEAFNDLFSLISI